MRNRPRCDGFTRRNSLQLGLGAMLGAGFVDSLRAVGESQHAGRGPVAKAVKIDSLERLPASYFVTASYMCWADRRRTLVYRARQVTIETVPCCVLRAA